MLKVVVLSDLNILQDEIDTQQDAYYKSRVEQASSVLCLSII
jgi:hypothetical protein